MELSIATATPRISPLDGRDRVLLDALRDGLPLVPEPYAALGAPLGLSAQEVIARLRELIELGAIRRFGVVVRHRELGYRANAMVVWDVPDERVSGIGRRLARLPFVTLCYRRERSRPAWPYNLYCMIHGRDRGAVEAYIEQASAACGLMGMPRAVLFSRRRFKQCGASYAPAVIRSN